MVLDHVQSLFLPCFCTDLMHCTNELNVNIPHLADTLFERTANQSWVVVFKALITTHHLMMYGNEVRFAGRILFLLVTFSVDRRVSQNQCNSTCQGHSIKIFEVLNPSGSRET